MFSPDAMYTGNVICKRATLVCNRFCSCQFHANTKDHDRVVGGGTQNASDLQAEKRGIYVQWSLSQMFAPSA